MLRARVLPARRAAQGLAWAVALLRRRSQSAGPTEAASGPGLPFSQTRALRLPCSPFTPASPTLTTAPLRSAMRPEEKQDLKLFNAAARQRVAAEVPG